MTGGAPDASRGDVAAGALQRKEFELGGAWTCRGRKPRETDITPFAGTSGELNPVHADEKRAGGSIVGKWILREPSGPERPRVVPERQSGNPSTDIVLFHVAVVNRHEQIVRQGKWKAMFHRAAR